MIKFNAFGWIVGHEDKGIKGSKTMRFDNKQDALKWISADASHRWIDQECLIVDDTFKRTFDKARIQSIRFFLSTLTESKTYI